MRHRLSSRAAKVLVKPGGMCWVIEHGRRVGRHPISTSRIASVPPVEAPMKMIFSVDRRPVCRPAAASPRGPAGPAACGCSRRPGAPTRDLGDDLLGIVADALRDAEPRLGDEVDRAQLQRAQRHFGAALGQRGDHHHRHRPQAHQPLEEVDAVHARHLDVERDHVGVGGTDHLARDQRVGRRADARHVGLRVDDLGQQAAHQRRVVDDQHLDLAVCRVEQRGQPNSSMSPATVAAVQLAAVVDLALAGSCRCAGASACARPRLPLAGKK